MPRLKRVSKGQQREKKKVQMRRGRKKAKDDTASSTSKETDGLNFPKKSECAENGLNFPKKSECAENGLNFPKKSECAENGLNFPKKSECAENGLNFPKKSECAENGLNFPKKSECAEKGLNFPKKSQCDANDLLVPAKCFTDSVTEALTETYSEPDLNFSKCFPFNCLNVSCDFDETFENTYANDIANRHFKTDKEVSQNEVILLNTDNVSIETDSFAKTIANSSAKMFSESIASCSAESITNSDSYSTPNSDSHAVNIACEKPFAVQFTESLGNDCLKTKTDFDEVFAEAFPYIFETRLACNNEELPKNKEVGSKDLIENNEAPSCDSHFEIIDTANDNEDLSERENMAFYPENTTQQNELFHKNVTAQNDVNCDPLETYSDNDVACYQAIRSSERLWNASDLVFGSFHQNDVRFSEQSRGYQCTCNALCMLSYSLFLEVNDSLILDKVLCEGDALYQTVISKLKSDGKFVHQLLSLEEIPVELEVEIGKFTLKKFQIQSGPLVDTQNLGLPTLHEVLQSAFLSVSSGLLTIGAICSAVFKKNGLYVFFDSHSHGENGLSSCDGASSLITFSNLNDLITYMYAFYDSLKLDTSLQYDFLPISVTKSEDKQSYKDEMASNLEAYFDDQRLRQVKKTHSNVRSISSVLSSISTEESKNASRAKTKKLRTEYYKIYKRQSRENLAIKAKDRQSKQSARRNPVFKAKETVYQKDSKQSARRNPGFKAKEIVYQKESKHSARKDTVFKTKERESKQSARRNPVFKANETVYQKESKQSARRNPVFKANETVYQKESKQSAQKDTVFKTKERESKQSARRNPVFKANETVYQKESKQSARRNPVFKANETVYQKESKQSARKDTVFKTKERESKQSARRNPVFKAKETVYQKESKQSSRKDTVFKTKERESKQSARRNPVFKAKEIVYQKRSKQLSREDEAFISQEKVYQNASKKKARENPYVLECERIKKQQKRQEKRKFNDDSGINVPRNRCKNDTDTLPKSHQKDLTIEESINRFHSDISIGPLYVCSCCHQTWFRKSVSMLKNTHISAESRRLYCTDFTSVCNEEWDCHTCLSALRENKPPKLSVANGMKWPDKPPELNLHQLEERLIELRIPFMQIRELPRGGQYSLKGNVINVPVDIQPTINCLPRPMDEKFTVAIQLKKKLSYKKVNFKENVRPLRVLSALHWLMNNSDLYKKSGIVVDDNWFQEVTESAEDTVREFLEVSKEQCNDKNDIENEKQKQDKTTEKHKGSNDYDSDHYSEIDANEQVGNIDTLVVDADIDNKYDKVFTFAPGEGQHPLSLYQDKDAEYLCFPTIFCGQTPPNRDERLVSVHYSDIVKWELRSIDRRAAQSVPNIFFKHKKLQMKQISDKVNLAVRRCKKRGQKITAAEARDSSYLDKLVNLDEGYYIFRQLRNSPAYLETRKKDIFAMIRQLSLPTWFMSLSAADT